LEPRPPRLLRVAVVAINAPPKNTAESLQVGKVLKYLARSCSVELITTRHFGGWKPLDQSLLGYLTGTQRVLDFPVPEFRWIVAALQRLPPRFTLGVDPDLSFLTRFPLVLQHMEAPDILYSRAMPHSSSLMALMLARWWRVPWVMHLSDPWVGNAMEPQANTRFNARMERLCIEAAARVTVTSPMALALYLDRYPAYAWKFSLFPNLFDDDDVWNEPPPAEGPVVVAHTGRLYGSRGPEPLLRAIEVLQRESPGMLDRLRFLFAGFLDDACAAQLRGSDARIKNLGPVSMVEARNLQRSAHALLLLDPQPVGGPPPVVLPSKILDYLAARRPIVAVTAEGTASHDIALRAGGARFAHEDAQGLARHLRGLVERRDAGVTAFPEPLADYAASVNVERLVRIFQEL
jgi:glycosyltransferase involved in cell wall biosynthesis